MSVDYNNLRKEILSEKMEYDNCVRIRAGINNSRERIKNVLFNHLNDILTALQEIQDLEQELTEITANECKEAEVEEVGEERKENVGSKKRK